MRSIHSILSQLVFLVKQTVYRASALIILLSMWSCYFLFRDACYFLFRNACILDLLFRSRIISFCLVMRNMSCFLTITIILEWYHKLNFYDTISMYLSQNDILYQYAWCCIVCKLDSSNIVHINQHMYLSTIPINSRAFFSNRISFYNSYTSTYLLLLMRDLHTSCFLVPPHKRYIKVNCKSTNTLSTATESLNKKASLFIRFES